MCNKVSYIITQTRTLEYAGVDSHNTILERAGIKDTNCPPDFVKCEMQINWASWERPETYTCVIDQDKFPDWWGPSEVEHAKAEGLRLARRLVEQGEWVFQGELRLCNLPGLTCIPEGLQVQWLRLDNLPGITSIPEGLQVQWLRLRNLPGLTCIPEGLQAEELYLDNLPGVTCIPEGLQAEELYLDNLPGLSAEYIAAWKQRNPKVRVY